MFNDKLIFPLGNFGGEYALTRHNAGQLVDLFMNDYYDHDDTIERELYTLKTLLYDELKAYTLTHKGLINDSGSALMNFMNRNGLLPIQNLLVIVDDLDLPVGTMRFSTRGGSGGHNGLRDIERVMNSRDYARIRIGIGRPAVKNPNYVMEKFTADELPHITNAASMAASCAFSWMDDTIPIARIQMVFNKSYEDYAKHGVPLPIGDR